MMEAAVDTFKGTVSQDEYFVRLIKIKVHSVSALMVLTIFISSLMKKSN